MEVLLFSATNIFGQCSTGFPYTMYERLGFLEIVEYKKYSTLIDYEELNDDSDI